MSSTAGTQAPIPVGPFALQKKIGEGGMGVVWQAFHPATRVRAAVKVLKSEKAWDLRTVGLFQSEVRAVAALDHPGVVMILDHGTLPASAEHASGGELVAGSPYLAMELVTGPTLFDQVGRLHWDELKGVLLGILDALGHGHARGVIHRDIKPSNVMIAGPQDLRPGAKLTDYGIAQLRLRPTDDPLDDANFCGSPSYISPEQFQAHHHDVGPWSDLYSLGCTIWAITTGTTVYRAPKLADMLEKHCRGELPPYQPIVDLPDGMGDWLASLLQPKITRRVQRAADAAATLMAMEPSGQRTIHMAPPRGPRTEESLEEAPTLDLTGNATESGSTSAPLSAELTPSATLPPIPPDWRDGGTEAAPIELVGAGLGLFGLRRVPFIGRDQARDRLWSEMLRAAGTGRTRAIVLRGGAGHGKSALAQWLCEKAEEVGAAQALTAIHGEMPSPKHGIGPMLGRLLRTRGFTKAETLRRARTRLKQLGWERDYLWHALTELIDPSDDPDNTQMGVRFPSPQERYVVATAFLEREARLRPLVLWLDDAQWGGDAVALARHLVELNASSPLPALILVAVRDEALIPNSFEAREIEALLARDDASEMTIAPLAVDEVETLVARLLRLDDDLANQVVDRADGNPLFAVQLVGDWVARGVLELGAEGFVLRDGASAAIPDDIHTVWSERFKQSLAERGEEARASLEIAAALGQHVDWSEWRGSCRRAGVAPPASLLGDLAAQGLVRSDPMGWAFVHGMARESLERSAVEAGRWGALNSVCADQVATTTGRDVNERVGRLLVAAGRRKEALKRLFLAAVERTGSGEHETARKLLDLHDLLLDELNVPPDDPNRANGRLGRARLDRLQGRLRSADLGSAQIVTLAEAKGWTDVLATARVEHGSALLARGRIREAAASLEAGRQLHKSLGDDDGAAAACVTLGYALRDLGELDTSVTAFRTAISIRSGGDGPTGLAEALAGLASVRMAQGQFDAAQDLLLQAIARLEQNGQLLDLARAWLMLSSLLCSRGDYPEAALMAERAREVRERFGNPGHTADCFNQEGEIHRNQGDLESAADAYQQAIMLYESIGSPWAFMPRINLALVQMDQDYVQLARRTLEAGWTEVKQAGRETVAQHIDALLLPCLAGAGDWDAWDQRMARVRVFVPGQTLVDYDSIRMLERAAELAEAGDRPARAAEARQLAAAHRQAHDT